MRWILGMFGGLWRLTRDASRFAFPNRGAAALTLFLFLFFAIVAVVLLLLGIDLDTADRWIDAQGGWLDAAGTLLIRAICAIVVLIAAIMVAVGNWQRLISPRHGEDGKPADKLGWGAIFAAAVVGYFAWFGVVS